MNNLTTRKIVLGMLMALVLTFSVQGIADALEFKDHSSTDGDLRTVLPGKEFTIKFSIRPESNTTKIYDDDGNLVDEDDNRLDSSGYFIAQDTGDSDDDGNTEEFLRTPVGDEDKPTTPKRYHYNEEAVTITVSSGVTIKKVGSRTLNSVGPHKLSETGKDATKLSSSNTLILTATTEGTVTITISDATPVEDKPEDAIAVTDFVFTVYVVYTDFDSGFPGTDFGLSQGPNGYNGFLSANDQFDPPIRAGSPTPSIPVVYEVAEGSGSLYVAVPGQLDERRTRSAKTLETSSDANVYLDMNGSTNKINAWVSGRRGTTSSTATYIYGGGTLEMIEKMIESGNGQEGAIRGRLEDPLVVRVKDDKNKPVSGVPIEFEATDVTSGMFVPVSGTIVYVTDASALVATLATFNEPGTTVTEVDPTNPPAPAERIFVQTDRSGEAKTYFRLGTEPTGQTKQQVDFSPKTAAVSQSVNHLLRSPFRVTALDSEVSARIVIVDGDGQRGEAETPLEDSLIVLVRNIYDDRISGVNVRFTTTEGIISLRRGAVSNSDAEDDISSPIKSGEEIFAKTDASGEVWVIYTVGSNASRQVVRAEIASEQDVELEYDFETLPVTFNINGGGTPSSDDDDDDEDEDDTAPASVTVTVPPTVSGSAGGTATLTVTAPATATVTAGGLGNTFLSTNVGSFTRSGTTFTSRLTLPNQVADFSLSVFVNNTRYPVTVSVTAAGGQTQTGGRLTVRVDPLSGAPGSTATVTVTATDSSAQPANATVSLTATGGTLSSRSVATGTTGTTTATLTRGSTAGSENFVTVSATNYDSVSGRFVIAGPVGRDMTVGAAENLDDYDGNNQMGSLNSPLAEPLVVEVLDANDNPVEDARVRFSTTIGSGRFSPRTPRTDEDGFAETTFTPTSAGRIRISASVAGVDDRAAFTVQAGDPADALEKVSGDTQSGTPGNALANPFVVEVQDEDGEPLAGHSVTFSVTAGGGSLSETSATTNANGRAQTTLTLGSAPGINSVQASVSGVDPVIFSTSIEAKILVAAANRPVMYWIAGGGLYSLSGAKEAKIAESANGVAVGGGKIYWTSQVNASSGAINSANLDGTNATVLTSILAVPMGIAVDTAGSKLYWTNTRGRIQSANLDGSSIKNELQNLSDPTDIVVSNGFIYWTEGGNSVRRVNISGQKIAIDVAVNLATVGGLAVGGGKVYWTEMTSASAGTVNGANLNGTNFETLATLLSAPMGIAVDTAGSKLYWTNARGRVQSANLDGSGIKNVVEGLISASKIAIGGANTETTTVKAATPAKKDNAKYDVNGDGKVDNVDASLVASGLDTGNAKYDVNSDGTVNFLDLLLVFDNRDDDAAAAPAIVGMKLNAIQIDRIEEQIDLLIATNDRSPAALRTLVYLQHLLATARPEKTQLFANYPNPFNPETWIPYELATDTHVKITIYNTQGVVIRTLQFGHQSAGYYTERDRAAYWDGRNALGEQVASGLYFYQLETDEMSSLRKMVILK